MNEVQDFAARIIREAGKIIMAKYGQVHEKKIKDGASDFATAADVDAEHYLISEIKRHYPAHGVVAEEGGTVNPGAQYIWYIDPIDGTYNFARNVPQFGSMMGLSKDGQVVLSAIYLPFFDELYLAQRGKGAQRNGQVIHCSDQKTWAHSIGCPSAHITPRKAAMYQVLAERGQKEVFWLNSIGSAAVAAPYVADGRRDWYYSADSKVWDYAAPSLLLSEAGCVVTNAKGEPWSLKDSEIVAANKHLHPELLAMLQESLRR